MGKFLPHLNRNFNNTKTAKSVKFNYDLKRDFFMQRSPYRKRILVFIFVTLLTFFSFSNLTKNDVQYDFSISINNLNRTYHLYIPECYGDEVPSSLLIALHGAGGSGKIMQRFTTLQGFDTLAEQENIIIAYPDAIQNHWNDGREDPYSYSAQNNIDDLLFISTLIDNIQNSYNIDKKRTYVCGMSNGGMMSFYLAFFLQDKISAIATVAASMPENLSKVEPLNRIPILMIHGTDDPVVPWEGGYVSLFKKNHGKVLSIYDTINFWKKHNNCQLSEKRNYLPNYDRKDGTRVWNEQYFNDDRSLSIVLYGIAGGGHVWPSGSNNLPGRIVGKMCYDINACNVIWDFFKSCNK
jgi:polyhydroxybutyrate depolymerase